MEKDLETFEAYCKSKLIDPEAFKTSDQELFNSLKSFFNHVSPSSFTQQKLFLINDIRRKYQLEKEVNADKNTAVKGLKAKPKIPLPKKPQ